MDWLELTEALQNMLVSKATGGSVSNAEYKHLRELLLMSSDLAEILPRFIRTCRDPSQFWAYIKQFDTYAERRQHIWDGFRPALEFLESQARSPADQAVGQALSKLDADHVQKAWAKALDRRGDDPEGAITSARTLLETVCKWILDDIGVPYDHAADLPQLYRLVAQNLKLGPTEEYEKIFKQIFGGCHAVVQGLATMRNKLSDSHGQGKTPIKPESRHAELAVNLAGTMAMFLVASWEARRH